MLVPIKDLSQALFLKKAGKVIWNVTRVYHFILKDDELYFMVMPLCQFKQMFYQPLNAVALIQTQRITSIYFTNLYSQIKNQTFHYTRRITSKRVTSWRCPSLRHIAPRQHSLLA